MGKKISLIAILTGVACLTGCSASNNSPGSVVDQMPARIACIQFDGKYVQTYTNTCPIAFDSWKMDKQFLTVEGRFLAKGIKDEAINLDLLQEKLNKESLPYVMSEYDSQSAHDKPIYSNNENTSWELLEVGEENCVSFQFSIDISPITSQERKIGELILRGDFYINHSFAIEEFDLEY